MKGVAFKNARKEAVTECWLCGEVMCSDCQASSQKELQGDRLARYGLTICQECITTKRRLTAGHKEYENIVNSEEVKFKTGIRKAIYNLTHSKQ